MSSTFQGMDAQEAREFAARFLPAWTGNDPDRLSEFYHPEAYYCDPAVPEGVEGRAAIKTYFAKLLAYNPEWVWSHEGSVPMPDGFINRWHASIPVGEATIECRGICLIQLRDQLIIRNEVYFDRSRLLAAIAQAK